MKIAKWCVSRSPITNTADENFMQPGLQMNADLNFSEHLFVNSKLQLVLECAQQRILEKFFKKGSAGEPKLCLKTMKRIQDISTRIFEKVAKIAPQAKSLFYMQTQKHFDLFYSCFAPGFATRKKSVINLLY